MKTAGRRQSVNIKDRRPGGPRKPSPFQRAAAELPPTEQVNFAKGRPGGIKTAPLASASRSMNAATARTTAARRKATKTMDAIEDQMAKRQKRGK